VGGFDVNIYCDEKDAARYRHLRSLIKTPKGLVEAQALLWNAAPQRKRLDAHIDEHMRRNDK
jgi:hypothetical protein